jgi:ribosomal protein L22
MANYTYNPDPKNSVKAYGRGLPVSTKTSTLLCRKISGMQLERGKQFLQRLIEQKESLGGKYYTGTAAEILGMLKSAENNVEFKGLDAARMIIKASAHNGFRYYRPRKFKMGRQLKKVTNLQVVLEQC